MDLSEKSELIYRHPWELSRAEILLKELKKIKIHGAVLDVGYGDGYFDERMLKMFPEITEFWGVDIYAKEKIYGRGRRKENYVNSYDEIKEKKFDYVLLMDVIEHIEDEVSFMEDLHKYLRNSTTLLITVPAFQWLFSLHDIELNHFRRYNFKMLKEVLEKSGYYVCDYSYAYFSLVFMRAITKSKRNSLGAWKYSENSLVTKLIKTLLNIDYKIVSFFKRFGIYIGGLSLFAICRQSGKMETQKIWSGEDG